MVYYEEILATLEIGGLLVRSDSSPAPDVKSRTGASSHCVCLVGLVTRVEVSSHRAGAW